LLARSGSHGKGDSYLTFMLRVYKHYHDCVLMMAKLLW
jgi:hypothetical protein